MNPITSETTVLNENETAARVFVARMPNFDWVWNNTSVQETEASNKVTLDLTSLASEEVSQQTIEVKPAVSSKSSTLKRKVLKFMFPCLKLQECRIKDRHYRYRYEPK